jgi:hypothetical protein
VESDYLLRNFKFTSGETLPEMRVHYRTLGQPARGLAIRLDGARANWLPFSDRGSRASALVAPAAGGTGLFGPWRDKEFAR